MAITASLERVEPPSVLDTLSSSSRRTDRLTARCVFNTVGATGLTAALVASSVALGGLLHDDAAPQQVATLTTALADVQTIATFDTALFAAPDASPNAHTVRTALDELATGALTATESRTLDALSSDWTRLTAAAAQASDLPAAVTDATHVRADFRSHTAALQESLQQRANTASAAAARQSATTRLVLLTALLGTFAVIGLTYLVTRQSCARSTPWQH